MDRVSRREPPKLPQEIIDTAHERIKAAGYSVGESDAGSYGWIVSGSNASGDEFTVTAWTRTAAWRNAAEHVESAVGPDVVTEAKP